MSWLTPIISVLGRLRQEGYQSKLGCTAGTTIVWVIVKTLSKKKNGETHLPRNRLTLRWVH